MVVEIVSRNSIPNHVPTWLSPESPELLTNGTQKKSMDEYLAEVKDLLEGSLDPEHLLALSEKLQEEFRQKLQSSDISMLPSYHHTLPTGAESGTFLALDMGGSNFRLALIELQGNAEQQSNMHLKRTKAFPIDAQVRSLDGLAFFEWVAERIEDMLVLDRPRADSGAEPLLMGLAWSFPIEQTSTRSGFLLQMGKGFSATNGVQGRDLCELIMTPCESRGLNVRLQTIVNDSSATLLAEAYREPTTRISLILGTGTNSAILMPVSALAPRKYGKRSKSWHEAAKHVIVNTELSMHGKHVWPSSRWDEDLNREHPMPDFQPLEHKVGGRYLGEIVRLILLEAARDNGLFEAGMPMHLQDSYTLETGMLAVFENDSSPSLHNASKAFSSAYPQSQRIELAELQFIRSVCRMVSNRAAAFEATAVHALWSLRARSEGREPKDSEHITIACNGSVLEKYPSFRSRCQSYLDKLVVLSSAKPGSVILEMAPESSIFGAAVAASCIDD